MSDREADELRTKGNDLYREIQSKASFYDYSTREKLVEADRYYRLALAVSSTAEKRASAYKNRGSLSFLWAKWALGNAKTWGTTVSEEGLTQCKQRLADTISYYSLARMEGRGNRTEWLENLEDLTTQLIDWAAENEQTASASADPSSEFSLLRSVCEAMDKPGQRCVVSCYAYGRIIDLLFWRGADIMEKSGGDNNGDKKGFSWISACQLPLEKLQTLSTEYDKKGDIATTVREWKDEITKSISLIDNLLKSQTRDPIKEKEKQEVTKRNILAKLGEKINILKAEAEKSPESYLRFLYANHTHPNPNYKLGKLSTKDETRETITTALRHYHPDRNVQHGLEWHCLCEEITKFLNSKYESYK